MYISSLSETEQGLLHSVPISASCKHIQYDMFYWTDDCLRPELGSSFYVAVAANTFNVTS